MTTEYPRANAVIRGLRATMDKVVICAGGYHVSALPERSLRELPLDFVVFSEGERTMVEICRQDIRSLKLSDIKGVAYLGENADFLQTAPREFIDNLDDLPAIDRDLLDIGMDWYLTLPGTIRGHLVERCTTILTSRGCPGNCLFCSSRAMWTNKVRQRSPDNVLDEIVYLRDRYGIKGLFFLDDTFTANKVWVFDFCKKWKERGLKIIWGCSARVNTVSGEMLSAMKEIGCVQLDFGVESGNDSILRTLHKGQNKKMILDAFELIHKYKLKAAACFIIGNPGETEAQMLETLAVAKKIKPNFSIFSILTPLPGSPLYNMAIKKGWINENESFDMRWSIRHSDMPVMGIEVPPQRLLQLRKHMEDRFLYTNYFHYFKPLIFHPFFIMQLFYQVIRNPAKYIRYIFGKQSRRFSGFIEAVFYDYKEYSANKLSRQRSTAFQK
jgi:radical SAM superfamily enzyme YgiQ (UPF0313 family)